MFRSARVKLTAFYLLIIMLVSLSFSLVIYKGVTFEFQRSFGRIERRLRAEERNFRLPPGPQPFFREDLEMAQKRVLVGLLYANGFILILSAAAGYFLAGRTLAPIEKAMEQQKRFVADASHELRTPLTALKTSMEVALRDKKISLKEAKKAIKSNLEDIEGLQVLSNNLLSLVHYQSNSQKLVFEDIDMAELIKDAYRKILPLAKEKEIEIKLNVKSQIIRGNEESLEEMLLIFLDNAVKYTPKGGQVTVTTKLDKKNLVIKIKDTGIGIAKEDIPYIFDRFYRVDQSRTRGHLRGGRLSLRSHDSSDGGKIGGFGLGLSLAKKIIEIHKGSVEVSSVLNKGTTFAIKLPL